MDLKEKQALFWSRVPESIEGCSGRIQLLLDELDEYQLNNVLRAIGALEDKSEAELTDFPTERPLFEKPGYVLGVAVHSHKNGETLYPFWVEGAPGQELVPDEDEFVRTCAIEFEPERGEFIAFHFIDYDELVPTFKPGKPDEAA